MGLQNPGSVMGKGSKGTGAGWISLPVSSKNEPKMSQIH